MSNVSILQGDCLDVLKTLPDQSIQCCVTSPPYYGLRDYGVSGQIGLEETPEIYINKLVAVFQEVKRVLKDDGTLWVNMGDSYWANRPTNGQSYNDNEVQRKRAGGSERPDIKPKDLIGIPWMLAFALRADGWWLRSDIIWAKPNPMPESVTDRPTKSHEYIFLLAKSQHYYCDMDAIKEPAAYDGRKDEQFKGAIKSYDGVMPNGQPQSFAQNGHARWNKDENGLRVRNKRDVWTVTTKPYKGAHFATFPPDLIEPCILAGSAVGDTILDPFNGSGTTGAVAIKHGRSYIGIELNPVYIELTNKRLAEVKPIIL
jgi:DNA modification methylase